MGPEGFSVELFIAWHGESEPEQSAASSAPQQVEATSETAWAVSTRRSWFRWYKVTGRDPATIANPMTYVQMAAAQNLTNLADILNNGWLTYPVNWVVEHVYEWTGRAIQRGTDGTHHVWKEVDFKSVPGFQKAVMATGNYDQPQVHVYAQSFLAGVKVGEAESQEVPTLEADEGVLYTEAVAEAYIAGFVFDEGALAANNVLRLPAPRLVNVTCKCSPIARVIYLQNGLSQLNVLGPFLSRNNLNLPEVLALGYRARSKSWQQQLHLTGHDEAWDIVIDWTCRTNIQGRKVSADSWWLDLTCSRNVDGRTAVTRVVAPSQEASSCVQGALSARFKVGLTSLDVYDAHGSRIDNSSVRDDIGMLQGSTTDHGNYLFLWVAENESTVRGTWQFSLAPYLPASY